MEFKGTKGNWIIATNNVNVWADNTKVANCDNNSQASMYRIKNEEEMEANALLISTAPELLKKLAEIVNILDIKCTDGCDDKTWKDFQNGNGEYVGLEIDKFIKEAKQLIKEAIEL